MCFFFVRSMSPTTHHALFLGFLFPLNSSLLPQHSMATTMEPWMLTSRRIIYDAVLEASSSVLDRDCRPVDFFSLLVAFVVLLEYTSCKDMDTEQEVSPISTHLCILPHTPSHTRVSRCVEFATKKRSQGQDHNLHELALPSMPWIRELRSPESSAVSYTSGWVSY